MTIFKINGKAVSYAEVLPSHDPGYLFDVTIDEKEYPLALNWKGVAVKTPDHQILYDHEDVVAEIQRREAHRWSGDRQHR